MDMQWGKQFQSKGYFLPHSGRTPSKYLHTKAGCSHSEKKKQNMLYIATGSSYGVGGWNGYLGVCRM